MRLHGKNMSSVYEEIDQSVLPREYLPDDYTGPSAGSVTEIVGMLILIQVKTILLVNSNIYGRNQMTFFFFFFLILFFSCFGAKFLFPEKSRRWLMEYKLKGKSEIPVPISSTLDHFYISRKWHLSYFLENVIPILLMLNLTDYEILVLYYTFVTFYFM